MDIARIAPRIKLSLQSQSGQDSAVFGSGVAQLCRGVEQWGSLNRAAKEMNMAYSKAWRIVKYTEASFGIQLLERNGAHGSILTSEGACSLHAYDELQQRVALRGKAARGNPEEQAALDAFTERSPSSKRRLLSCGKPRKKRSVIRS